jgi:hypothetical protein
MSEKRLLDPASLHGHVKPVEYAVDPGSTERIEGRRHDAALAVMSRDPDGKPIVGTFGGEAARRQAAATKAAGE